MKKVVIYPGRFQPMLKHHADVYAAIQRAFPDAEVYVATSDKTDPPKSPFNFSEKQSIITAHNIPADHVLKVTSPYSWQEYANKFDGTKTILIYAVGGKDTDRFKFNLDKDSGLNLKKDGTVAHVQPMTAIKEDPKPMTERSYVYFIPTLTSGTGEELSASKFREELKKAPNLAAAKKLYTKQFGHYNEHVFSLIYSKLKGKSSMNEQVNLIRKLAGLAEAAPVHFGQDGDPAKAKFVPGSDSAAGMSIANRFPEGADVNDPATKKEEFLKALVSAPAALLAEINGRLDPKDHNSLQVGERLNEIISQLESSNGALSTLSADDKSFAVALTANAVKNMSLDRGDTGAAPEEEDLKDSFNLDELRIRAGISPLGEGDDESNTGYGPEVLDHPDIAGMIDDTMDGGYHDGAKYKRAVITVSQELGMSPREVDQQYRAISPYSPYVPEVSFDESMSADHNDDDDDDYEPSTFKDEWGRDTEEQDQWKKNVTGKKNKNEVNEEIDPITVGDKVTISTPDSRFISKDLLGKVGKVISLTGNRAVVQILDSGINVHTDLQRLTKVVDEGADPGKFKLSQGMSESQEDDDESVGYDDEDDNDWEAGIDWDEEEDADDEEDYVDESQTFNEEKLPMVKLADIMADYGLTEASKPDFLDMDKDGDKKEPMKKAVKDAEKKPHDKEKKTDESIEEHITSTSENAVQQALSELRKLAGL